MSFDNCMRSRISREVGSAPKIALFTSLKLETPEHRRYLSAGVAPSAPEISSAKAPHGSFFEKIYRRHAKKLTGA